jgi:hypothetical protein
MLQPDKPTYALLLSVFPNGIAKDTYKFTLSIDFDSAIVSWNENAISLLEIFPGKILSHIQWLATNRLAGLVQVNGNAIPVQSFDISFLDCKVNGSDQLGMQIWKEMFPAFPVQELAQYSRKDLQKARNMRLDPLFNQDRIKNTIKSFLNDTADLHGQENPYKRNYRDAFSLDIQELSAEYVTHRYGTNASRTASSARMKTHLQNFKTSSERLNEQVQAIYTAQGILQDVNPKAKNQNDAFWEYFFTATSHLKSNVHIEKFTGTLIDFEVSKKDLITALAGPTRNDAPFRISMVLDKFFASGSPLEEGKVNSFAHLSNSLLQKFTVGTAKKEKIILQTGAQKRFYENGYFKLGESYRIEKDRDEKVVRYQGTFKPTTYSFAGKLLSIDSDKAYQFTNYPVKDQKALGAFVRESLFTANNGISIHADKWHDDLAEHDIYANGLFENDVLRGQRLFAVGAKDILPTGQRELMIRWVDNSGNEKELCVKGPFVENHVIKTDTTNVTSATNVDGEVEIGHLLSNSIFTWIGQNTGMKSVFRNAKDDAQHSEEPTANEAVTRYTNIIRDYFFPFFKSDADEYTGRASNFLKFNYGLQKKNNPLLLYKRGYRFVMANTYKNGWSPADNQVDANELTLREFMNTAVFPGAEGLKSPSIPFLRFDPLEAPYVVLYGDESLEAAKTPPSKDDLVIRSEYDSVSNDVDIRFIAPPRVNFQQAWWYGLFFHKNEHKSPDVLDKDESFAWYQNFHNAAITDEFKLPERASDYFSISYLPDPCVQGFEISLFYDDDIAVKGADGNPITKEIEFSGKWPNYDVCQVVLKEGQGNYPVIEDTKNSYVMISIKKGSRLKCKLRSTIKPAYHAYFHYADDKFLTVIRQKTGDENIVKLFESGKVELMTPPRTITLTNAVKQPLFRPAIISNDKDHPIKVYRNNTILNKPNTLFKGKKAIFSRDSSIKSDTEIIIELPVYFEHLNFITASAPPFKELEGKNRTGEISLLSTSKIFTDNAALPVNLSKPETIPTKPYVNYKDNETEYTLDLTLIPHGEILKIAKPGPNDFKNYYSIVAFRFDVKETKYFRKKIAIRNRSSFTDYFQKDIKDPRNTLTSESWEIEIPNNSKPVPPRIHKIIPIIFTTNIGDRHDPKNPQNTYRKIRRSVKTFRVYLERGRQTSGEGEKLGIIVYHNEKENVYNDYYNTRNEISIVGRDITTYSNNPCDQELKEKNPNLLMTSKFFSPKVSVPLEPGTVDTTWDLVKDAGVIVADVHFDTDLSLWYGDFEITIADRNGRQIYCPIIQLHTVHYQEKSMNYNNELPTGETPKFANDMRISDATKATLIYLLPTRLAYLRMTKHAVEIELTELSHNSLKLTKFKSGGPVVVRSRFFAAIRYDNGMMSEFVESTNENGEKGVFHSLEIPSFKSDDDLNKLFSVKKLLTFTQRYRDVKLCVVEMEDFDYEMDQSSTHIFDESLLDNRKFRLVYYEEVRSDLADV